MNGLLRDNGINGVIYARTFSQVILQLSMEVWQADPDRSIRKRVSHLARSAWKVFIDHLPILSRCLDLYLFRQGLLALTAGLWSNRRSRFFGCPFGCSARCH